MAVYTVCDTAVVPDHNPLFIPDFDTGFDLWPSFVIRIGRLGKSVAPRFAHRYVEALGAGVLVQGHDLLRNLSARGMPWMEAVSFDNAAPHGTLSPAGLADCEAALLRFALTPLSEFAPDKPATDSTPFTLPINLTQVISDLSRNYTLKNGDLIYIACTPQALPATPDTRLTLWLGETRAATIRIK